MRRVLQHFLEALFRVLFTYECRGQENIPASGPAVIASNHPSYLDPILLSLHVDRPIRFMAWDALFRIPFLGLLVRTLGAFPVDVRKGKGRLAYERARALVKSGEVIGIFPEGKRSRMGWLEPALREGVARLAWETGAPLVPASIAGAYRAWPHFQSLPTPARIKVRFHEPILPSHYSHLSEDEALESLLIEMRRRVERSLLPGVKADLRMNVLYRTPAPWPRPYETIPPLVMALLIFWQVREITSVIPAYAYLFYLLLDHLFVPQNRLIKWIRTASPVLFVLLYGPTVLKALSIPDIPIGVALLAILGGAFIPYLYERGNTALDFMRGMVVAACAEGAVLCLVPTGIGPHVTLPLFAAVYAWSRRTVFYRYAAPVLGAYAVLVPFFMGGGVELLPHATVALISWLFVRIYPYRFRVRSSSGPMMTGLGIGS